MYAVYSAQSLECPKSPGVLVEVIIRNMFAESQTRQERLKLKSEKVPAHIRKNIELLTSVGCAWLRSRAELVPAPSLCAGDDFRKDVCSPCRRGSRLREVREEPSPRLGDSALASAPFCLGSGRGASELWWLRKRSGCRTQESPVGFHLRPGDRSLSGTPPTPPVGCSQPLFPGF